MLQLYTYFSSLYTLRLHSPNAAKQRQLRSTYSAKKGRMTRQLSEKLASAAREMPSPFP